ncbi:hypothetical protein QWY85_19865 [Neolewinella lacunae]|uniref:Uncharacterized protein n=1 Tax=Neolewinella lacunae TaxID=1517758 RepID=A0A923PMR3_9BACT|nr:hypothetical protein [Neolewinella lacunae]MBC6996314.1 hypothetical protein [Neolewinella lacunae]MDN3636937.1 hypothetical protein [Neolewinella lacunae]
MPKLLPFGVLLFLCFACSPEQDELNVRLTLEDREEIDRRVTAYMDSLRPLLDSLCTASMTDRIAIATDSIVQRRLEEEARLRARIPQNLRNDR